MFALFEKLFRFRRIAALRMASLGQDGMTGVYSISPPIWLGGDRCVVFRGLTSDAVAIVRTPEQALTLRDTLNLANGDRPSRRLLDALYLEEATLESDPPSHA